MCSPDWAFALEGPRLPLRVLCPFSLRHPLRQTPAASETPGPERRLEPGSVTTPLAPAGGGQTGFVRKVLKQHFMGLLWFPTPAYAHQDKRRELSGQTDPSRRVDPQQVVGRHIQVVVAMGWRKNTHLFTKRKPNWLLIAAISFRSGIWSVF